MRRAWSPPELGHTKQDEQDELVGRFFDNKISEAHLRARLQILGCYEKMISQIVSSVRYERDETGRQRAHRAKKK